jgi:hypothetical protein
MGGKKVMELYKTLNLGKSFMPTAENRQSLVFSGGPEGTVSPFHGAGDRKTEHSRLQSGGAKKSPFCIK